MRKRTRIAVVVAALLVAVVAPAVNPPTRQVAVAGPVNWEEVGEVVATLDRTIPKTGWTRTGRPAFPTAPQRLTLEKVACKVNGLHDNLYDYEPAVDTVLSDLDLPNPYRFQSQVVTLSRQLHEFKDDIGPAYQIGTARFCGRAGWSVERNPSAAAG